MLFCDVSLKVLRIFCTNFHLLPKHYLLHILRNYDILSLPDEVYQFYKAFYLRSAHRFYFVLPKYICSISFGCLNVNEKSCVFTKYCFFVKGAQIMYEVFEQLLQKFGVTPYKISKQAGLHIYILHNTTARHKPHKIRIF